MSSNSPAPVRLAVFDYDGTIISGQSGLLIAWYMLTHRLMKPRHAARLALWGIRYATHLPHREEEARELVFKSLIGQTPEEVMRFMQEFHDAVLAPLYRPKAEQEVALRESEGCTVLLVSATFQDLADIAATRLGMDAAIATLMEMDENDRYTGYVEGDVIEGPMKLVAVERWANDHLGAGSWELYHAYGDHASDVELLSAAAHAYAVSPKALLRRHAKRCGWAVLDWKK